MPDTNAAEVVAVCTCGAHLVIEACRSAAGWYAGLWCPECGPYDRLSFCYYDTEEEVQALIDKGAFNYA